MLKRKDKILISAIELLSEEGVNGITTKKLAAREKVSEPALYRQYKNKQAILDQIMVEYASYDEMIFKTINQSELKGKEAVSFYVKRYAELYQNYEELTTVMLSLDLYFYNDFTKDMMIKTDKSRNEFLEKIIKKDKNEFLLGERLNAKELAELINGTITSQVLEWRLSGKSYKLDNRLNDVINRLL